MDENQRIGESFNGINVIEFFKFVNFSAILKLHFKDNFEPLIKYQLFNEI